MARSKKESGKAKMAAKRHRPFRQSGTARPKNNARQSSRTGKLKEGRERQRMTALQRALAMASAEAGLEGIAIGPELAMALQAASSAAGLASPYRVDTRPGSAPIQPGELPW